MSQGKPAKAQVILKTAKASTNGSGKDGTGYFGVVLSLILTGGNFMPCPPGNKEELLQRAGISPRQSPLAAGYLRQAYSRRREVVEPRPCSHSSSLTCGRFFSWPVVGFAGWKRTASNARSPGSALKDSHGWRWFPSCKSWVEKKMVRRSAPHLVGGSSEIALGGINPLAGSSKLAQIRLGARARMTPSGPLPWTRYGSGYFRLNRNVAGNWRQTHCSTWDKGRGRT